MDSTMPDRGLPLSLWGIWWNAILLLRPAFSRLRTFMWFATAVAGLTVRLELLGVTSIVRALNLRPRLYTKLLDHFHSSGINLDRLSALWTQAVLQMFPHLVRVNGRLVLVGDGIKSPQARQENAGRKAPASAIGIKHQARIHHGALHPGRRIAGTRGQERLLRAARRAHPRRPGMVQPRQAHLARQDARLDRYPGPQGPLLLCRRCLLRRRQDGARPAQAGQPSRDPGQIQCGRLRSRHAQERQKDKGATQDLWQEEKAQVLV